MTSEMTVEYFFPNLAFWLHGNQSKFSGLDKIDRFGRGLLKEHFCKTLVKISAVMIEIAINTNFHFSHYKSMETKLP